MRINFAVRHDREKGLKRKQIKFQEMGLFKNSGILIRRHASIGNINLLVLPHQITTKLTFTLT